MEVFLLQLLLFVVFWYFSNTSGKTKQSEKAPPPSNTNKNSVNEKKASYHTIATTESKPVVAKTPTSKIEPLCSKKEAILNDVSNYTLTHKQVYSVLESKYRYSFSDNALEILRRYKDRIYPPVRIIIQTCSQWGIVDKTELAQEVGIKSDE